MSEPCHDCPQTGPRDENGEIEPHIPNVDKAGEQIGLGWILYSGGPPEHHLSMMQHTLPPDYEKAHFLPDGSIEYEKGPDGWEPPSPIEGYECDSENQWLFRPLWNPCQLRMFGAVVKESCECIQVLAMCGSLDREMDQGAQVTYEECKDCPHQVPILPLVLPQMTPRAKPFRGPR